MEDEIKVEWDVVKWCLWLSFLWQLCIYQSLMKTYFFSAFFKESRGGALKCEILDIIQMRD